MCSKNIVLMRLLQIGAEDLTVNWPKMDLVIFIFKTI